MACEKQTNSETVFMSAAGGGKAPSEGFMLQILQDGMWQKGNI